VPKESAAIEYHAALKSIKSWIKDMDKWEGNDSNESSTNVSSTDVSREGSVKAVATLKPAKTWNSSLDRMNSLESDVSREGSVKGVEVPSIQIDDVGGMPVAPRITLVEQRKGHRTPGEYFHRSVSST
jgi:hypothetical protein